MTNTELLQLTVNSFNAQIEHIDKEIASGMMQLESMKNARSSMLASVSVLETRIAEMRLEEPEQLELDLDDDFDEPLGVACSLDGEACESCQ
jgi:chromosome segregation ATPase